MAARAQERARQHRRDHQPVAAAYEQNKNHDWLNGWPRISAQQILMGTEVRCVCCGQSRGITCVAFSPDWEPPGPEPMWPFTPADCPLCTTE